MTDNTSNEPSGTAQDPMEEGKVNAQRLIAHAVSSESDEPPADEALKTAIENAQQADQQAQRARNILQSAMMTVKILETVSELNADGLLDEMGTEGTVLEDIEETDGIDDETGAVVEGIETE